MVVILRTIFVPKREEVRRWRKLHNDDLHNFYAWQHVTGVIKSRRIGLAVHVILRKTRLSYKCPSGFMWLRLEGGGISGAAYRLGFPRRVLFRGVSYTFMIISTKLVVVRRVLKCNNLLSLRQRPGYTKYTTRRHKYEYRKNIHVLSTRTSGVPEKWNHYIRWGSRRRRVFQYFNLLFWLQTK
jgi:hypothetical protein